MNGKTETKKVKKERYLKRQDNIQSFDKFIFFKYSTRQMKATERSKKVIYLT